MAVNKVILVGNVGKDPEVHFVDSNVPVARFPFATSETYRSRDGEKVTSTEWHNIVMWRGLAEIADKFVKKGSQLYIEGKIRSRSYDDREGNKRYITEVVADNMQLLGRRSDTGSTETQSNDEGFGTANGSTTDTGSKTGDFSEVPGTSAETGAPDSVADEPDDLPF
ncbi:MAG TPA: single-stranded DNA-binding protein [Bacteroidales bacterium]|nr:single-stranded DNA-binding protein [Bacteroidales bacterium]